MKKLRKNHVIAKPARTADVGPLPKISKELLIASNLKKTYKGRLFQGGLYRFEDRKEKQFMFENHYGHTIPRRESIVKRQVCIFILYYVMIKWKMLQKSLRIL